MSDKISARPICLINETAKIFERIINDRMITWMQTNPDSDLANKQFGFRREKSTVDALMELRGIVEAVMQNRGVAIAVSIDIKNAFNSVPWSSIRASIRKKKFPSYLVRIVDSYLKDRIIVYENTEGYKKKIQMQAGVPQESIFGLLLWNIAYDEILQGDMEEGSQIICFADDTIIIAEAQTIERAITIAKVQISRTLRKIRQIGLEIAIQKTGVLIFTKQKKYVFKNKRITIDGHLININDNMKYLGVVLDSKLNFDKHDKYVADKAMIIMKALRALMPNLRGPTAHKRRLYAYVVYSVLLYAAPLWAKDIIRKCKKLKKSPQVKIARLAAQRVISAYRTVSAEVALILSKLQPLDISANKRQWLYNKTIRNRESGITNLEKQDRNMAEKIAIAKWKNRIAMRAREESTCNGRFLWRQQSARRRVLSFCARAVGGVDQNARRGPQQCAFRRASVGGVGENEG